ncbi:MAG: hypothetical protein ACR2JY_24780 [Chloroflexota bacterium]
MKMIARSLTVTIPEPVYEQLQQRARQAQRSVEDEAGLTLAATLPTWDDIPTDLATTLVSLPALDDDALWRLARSRVRDEDAARLMDLGDRRQRGELRAEELREAEELVQRHDRVLVTRAEAAALLKQRGYDVTVLLRGE